MGNRTKEEVRDPAASLKRKREREYNSLNQLIKDIGGVNPATEITQYGYDALGQLTRVTHPNGRVVVYDYDEAGNRRQVTDNGVTTAYTTNNLNQYTQVGNVTYAFDADGNLVSQTENGVTTTYAYDAENRLVLTTALQ